MIKLRDLLNEEKKVSEEVFEKVKSGQYKMFSIQGKAKRLNL